MFELKRGALAEGRVTTVGVVKAFDVIKEYEPGDSMSRSNGSAEAFGFECGKEAFHHRIVVRIGAAAHRPTGPGLLQ